MQLQIHMLSDRVMCKVLRSCTSIHLHTELKLQLVAVLQLYMQCR